MDLVFLLTTLLTIPSLLIAHKSSGKHIGQLHRNDDRAAKGCPRRCNMPALAAQVAVLTKQIEEIKVSLAPLISKVVERCNASHMFGDDYSCEKAYDNSTDTAWVAGRNESWIQLFLETEATLTSCDLSQTSFYVKIKDVRIEFSDDSTHQGNLAEYPLDVSRDKISFSPVVTSWVRITILTTYEGGYVGLTDIRCY